MARPKTYTDPVTKSLRVTFTRSQAQARSRGEQWLISWEDYYHIWTQDGSVLRKGRGQEDLCLARINPTLSWTIDNVCLEQRSKHLARLYTGVPKTKKVALDPVPV